MSNVLGPELSTFELHFSSFQLQLKAADMHSGSSGSGEAGWPSPTSIASVSEPGSMPSAPHTSPSGHEAAGMSGGLAMDPPSFSLHTNSGFPVSQGFYGEPSPPMTSSWAYQAPAVPETVFQPYMAPQPVEPLPMHQLHHGHGGNSRRISFGAVDEELEADARMLREVLQGPPTTDAGGLQLLFVPPVEPSREQLQHPLISSAVFSSAAQPFPAFPPLTTTPATAKRDDFSIRPLLSSLSLSMTPSGSHSSMLKTVDSALSFSSLIKHDEHSSVGSASSSPSLHQQLASAAAHVPASSPTVSYATGVPTLSMSTASALPKKKRSSSTRICKVEGCTTGIRSRGLCKAHGGGRRCTTPGCTTSDQGGGHCVLHGGGRRCSVEGCTKSAQWRGVCKMHGGARRCRYGQCTKNGQVKQGYCRMHHNLLTAQRQQQEQFQVQQQQQLQQMQQTQLPPVPAVSSMPVKLEGL
jgi:hypothetical protein